MSENVCPGPWARGLPRSVIPRHIDDRGGPMEHGAARRRLKSKAYGVASPRKTMPAVPRHCLRSHGSTWMLAAYRTLALGPDRWREKPLACDLQMIARNS